MFTPYNPAPASISTRRRSRRRPVVDSSPQNTAYQRLSAQALGYEEINDHDDLRIEPLSATVLGKDDSTGQVYRRPADRSKALAGKSNLIELGPSTPVYDIRPEPVAAGHDISISALATLLRKKGFCTPGPTSR